MPLVPVNSVPYRLANLPPDWLDRSIYAAAGGRLTFGDLRDNALRFGGWLSHAASVRSGDLVAVCLPKSLASVQAIYGILAAGAVYVPLQYQGPPARLRAILDSLQARLLLTTGEMAGRLALEGDARPMPPLHRIEADASHEDLERLWRGLPALSRTAAVDDDDLAAIYFTSGSTGEPKGVMWSHRSMAASIAAMPRLGRLSERDRLIGVAGLHYSASAEIFFPLVSGGMTYLLSDREAMFADRIAEILEHERTTVWSASATALRLLVESAGFDRRDLSALRRVDFYGERMSFPALRQAMAALPRAEFHNLYAASEAFYMIEFAVPRPLPDQLTALPLGRPSSIYELSLRAEDGSEVMPGETGEICVVGPSVMMGYWQDPDLTQAKRVHGRRDSYRTGDLAFLAEDGFLHFVGRKDHVVKLRGHRFDLGEIEAALKAHPAVRDAVAFPTASAGKIGELKIGAAVLSDALAAAGGDLASELRRHCLTRLPAMARPARILVLERFPTLSSGKIDRRALEALIAAR